MIESLDDRKVIINIWNSVFQDDAIFINEYMDRYGTSDNYHLASLPSGEMVSMAHSPLFKTQFGEVGYMYAVATLDSARRLGLSHKVINKLLLSCNQRHYIACLTFPQTKSLEKWYCKDFDFVSLELPLIFHTDDSEDFVPEPPVEANGLIRITDMEKYLSIFASLNPSLISIIICTDKHIPQNTGIYTITKGNVKFEANSAINGDSPSSIFQNYPIGDLNQWNQIYLPE